MEVDVLYTIYTDDVWEDEEVFRSGNKLTFQLMSNFKLGAMDMILFMRERIKGKNKTGTVTGVIGLNRVAVALIENNRIVYWGEGLVTGGAGEADELEVEVWEYYVEQEP